MVFIILARSKIKGKNSFGEQPHIETFLADLIKSYIKLNIYYFTYCNIPVGNGQGFCAPEVVRSIVEHMCVLLRSLQILQCNKFSYNSQSSLARLFFPPL